MSLYLYHVTVQIPGAITASESFFSGSNEEHLVLARGQWLEVHKIEEDEVVLKSRTNVFASIRCIQRIPTQGQDALALTSDSGDFVILSYDCESARFSKLASESMGRSAFRRTSPGEYLAVDPKGRVAMLASIEKLRTVYVLHPEGITSSVEAPAQSTFCYNLVAMDRGYGNPAFAALERFRFGQKAVVMYEFNLGLNHLVKIWSHTVTDDTDIISSVPGGRDGPSGIVVFSGSTALYLDPKTGESRYEVALPQPVVCASTVRVRRNEFFIIAQMIDGNCLSLTVTDDGLLYTVFGLLPYALHLQVMKSGHVFVACESGDHVLTQLASLQPLHFGEFITIPALSSCVSSTLQRKQIVTVNHSGSTSRISLLKYGRNIEELVSTPLPGIPTAVFASKRSIADAGHRIIALSFEKANTFLSVADDGSVNETSESETGLSSKVHMLGLHCIGDDAIVQVHTSGFRYVGAQTFPWLAPKGSNVTGCAFTATQMLLVLNRKQVLYFEARDGTIVESKQRLDLQSTPTAVCFESPSAQELRSMKFYVSCEDESVRLFSVVDFKQKTLYNSPAPVTSMLHNGTLYLGHTNGTYSALHRTHFWTRVLGSDPVKLVSVEHNRVLALTSRTWVISGNDVSPLANSSSDFTSAHPFITEDVPDGVIGVSGSSLVVFTVPSIDKGAKASKLDLAILPSQISRLTKNVQSNFWYACGRDSLFVIENRFDGQMPSLSSRSTGSPCVACSNVRFDSHAREFLVLATKTSIQTYEYVGSPLGSELSLHHETRVEQCSAIHPFKGMLLAAVNGNRLVLYDLGLKQLLRKVALDLPDLVVIKQLRVSRNRIYVGDSRNSVTVLSYEPSGGFTVIYKDPFPRSVTAMVVLDHVTVCIGDQYGNIAILRGSADAEALELTDNNGGELQLIAHFRVSDGIVDLHKGVLSPVAGIEAIIYTGIQGTVGALIPVSSKEDQVFMLEVESEVNRRISNLAGRDNCAFRGYYSPVKNVVDGDLCESAVSSDQGLDSVVIDDIAETVGSDANELVRRVKTFRERSVF